MAKTPNVNTNFLFLKKEEIYENIKKISEKPLQKRIDSFESSFDDIEEILITMGTVLYEFIKKQYFENTRDFKFYFWPGFSTLKHKRVLIRGLEKEDGHRYFTGIGWDNNENFRNCPMTLAYDRIFNNIIFEKSDFCPGSTHHFRVNQSKEGEFGKEYLKLRVNGDNVFKAIHVTTDKKIRTDSQHTQLIQIEQKNIEESALTVRKKIDDFLDTNKGKYRWPFNALSYEDKINKKIIELKDIFEYQENDIELQTHLYSYWIAETLGAFKDKNKEAYKQKLYKLLKKSNKLYLKEKLGFFDEIDKEKERVKITSKQAGDDKDSYKETHFKHWYTLYHEGISLKEDLGSTMILTSHNLNLELLYYIASWIEDIYNNLKLVESMAAAEFEAQKKNFKLLKHSQVHYISAQRQYVKEDLDNICDDDRHILDAQLDFISDILDVSDILEGKKINDGNLNEIILSGVIIDHLKFCVLILLKKPNIAERNFKRKTVNWNIFCKNAILLINVIIQKIQKNTTKIKADERVIKLVIKDLITNALENTNQSKPKLDITIEEKGDKIYFSVTNNISVEEFRENITEEKYTLIQQGTYLEGNTMRQQLGWRTIFSIIEYQEWSFEVPQWEDVIKNESFTFTIIIS